VVSGGNSREKNNEAQMRAGQEMRTGGCVMRREACAVARRCGGIVWMRADFRPLDPDT